MGHAYCVYCVAAAVMPSRTSMVSGAEGHVGSRLVLGHGPTGSLADPSAGLGQQGWEGMRSIFAVLFLAWKDDTCRSL